jgi:hypothetical protein
LPIDLATFWSSSPYKVKLEAFICDQIQSRKTQLFKDTILIVSGLADGTTHCQCISNGENMEILPELTSSIEEADARLMPHILHATKDEFKRNGLYTIASRLGTDMCAVLPAIHNLTGSNTCSKIGTKKSGNK